MKQQQGRTLIETLSILCIIGILSVFGLKLYAKAMNSVRANYIMQQVFIKANSLVENPVATRHRIVYTDFQDKQDMAYGYSFGTATHNRNDKKFYIYINGYFSKNLCEMLKKNIATDEYPGLKMLVAKRSGQSNVELTSNTGTCPSDTETMIFHINDDFKNTTQNKSNKSKSF